MPNCYTFSVYCVQSIEFGLNISSLVCLRPCVWTSVSVLKIPKNGQVSGEDHVSSELYKTEVFGEGPLAQLLCTSEIPHFLTWDRTRSPVVIRRQVSTSTIKRVPVHIIKTYTWIGIRRKLAVYFKCRPLYPRHHITRMVGGHRRRVWMFWRNEKSLVHAGIRNPIRPACSLVTSPTELHRPFPPEPRKCRTTVELTWSTM